MEKQFELKIYKEIHFYMIQKGTNEKVLVEGMFKGYWNLFLELY